MMENTVWQTILAALGGLAGGVVLIVAMGKWFADRASTLFFTKKEQEFTQHLAQQQHEHARQLAELQNKLAKKNYISKVRFDLEIEIYRELSEAVFQLTDACSHLHFNGISLSELPQHIISRHTRYEKAISNFYSAKKSIVRNTPFIPEVIYSLFINITELCNEQIIRYDDSDDADSGIELIQAICSYNKCALMIKQQQDTLIQELREHIASLDVLDAYIGKGNTI